MYYTAYRLDLATWVTQDMSIKQASNKFDQSIKQTYEDLQQASEDSPIGL